MPSEHNQALEAAAKAHRESVRASYVRVAGYGTIQPWDELPESSHVAEREHFAAGLAAYEQARPESERERASEPLTSQEREARERVYDSAYVANMTGEEVRQFGVSMWDGARDFFSERERALKEALSEAIDVAKRTEWDVDPEVQMILAPLRAALEATAPWELSDVLDELARCTLPLADWPPCQERMRYLKAHFAAPTGREPSEAERTVEEVRADQIEKGDRLWNGGVFELVSEILFKPPHSEYIHLALGENAARHNLKPDSRVLRLAALPQQPREKI
jgi:hypothetical protein